MLPFFLNILFIIISINSIIVNVKTNIPVSANFVDFIQLVAKTSFLFFLSNVLFLNDIYFVLFQLLKMCNALTTLAASYLIFFIDLDK